jgi:hypothetical protein
VVSRVVRRNHPAAGQDLAHVVEDDHSVTEQAPALLGVEGDGMGGAAVRAVSGWAWGPVWAHFASPGMWLRSLRSWGPAEAADGDERAGGPPGGQDGEVVPVEPGVLGEPAEQGLLNGRTGKAPEMGFSMAE